MIIADLTNENALVILKDAKYFGLHRCIEELLLWKGENPMDIEAGVDYYSVFNKQKFLKNELTFVLDKYSGEFQSTQVESINYDSENETIKAAIIFTLAQNESIRVVLNIANRGF